MLLVDAVPTADSGEPEPHTNRPHLIRAMRFRDVLLFLIVTGFSVRWIANAAAAGPSAIAIWIIACVTFYLPLVLTVIELSSRYPHEGGVYVWSTRAFGPFAGFTTAWTYWASNLPYFPAVLYFAAANALYMVGAHAHGLADNRAYFIVASVTGLLLAMWLNVVGLGVGKWLHNAGALGSSIPAIILIGLAGFAWARSGSATAFTPSSLVPSTHLKDIIFWSTVAFSISGAEGASMLGDEIENPRRTVPRALLIAGTIIITLFILATAAVLVVLPPERITIISGFMDAVSVLAHRVGGGTILVAIVAAMVTIGAVGQCGGWFAAAARLPFVAGIDRFLPAAFGRLHPRWGTPYVALLVQGAVSIAFIVVSQVGTGVQGAYDILVSVSVISYFIPYLFMFAAMVRVQRLPADPGTMRVPGGSSVGVLVGAVGFVTTAISVVLALIPAPDEPAKWLAFAKVAGSTTVLVVIGVVYYAVAGGRAGRALARTMPAA